MNDQIISLRNEPRSAVYEHNNVSVIDEISGLAYGTTVMQITVKLHSCG